MPTGTAVYFSPARILLLSLLSMILLGTFILWFPVCHKTSLTFIDILFTAVSAVCVDGTLTVDINSFTIIGQCILITLVQIGGLGIVTLTFFLISLFLNLNFASQLMAGQLLEVDSWKNIKQTISFIIGTTLIIELLGAIGIWFTLSSKYSFLERAFLALFHSISAFCHAGFSLYENNLIGQEKNIPLLLVIISIMIVGSLGFLTLQQLFLDPFFDVEKPIRRRFSLSLQTKLVLIITTGTIIGGTILFLLLERTNTLSSLSLFDALVNSLFNIVSARGIGLNTVPINQILYPTALIIMFLAFIGSSPGSPGSGIKTTTFAVFCASVKSTVRGDQSVLLFGRRIAKDQVNRAIAIVSVTLGWLLISTFLLLLVEQDKPFFDIIFESVSALFTLGLSTGITPALSTLGKVIIMITIIVGRVSVFAFLISLLPSPQRKEFSYPEERIMLG